MSVISGIGGAVNNKHTVRRWSISSSADIQKIVASNTKGGPMRIAGNGDWSGSYQAYGHTPESLPGEALEFEGSIDGTKGASGDAIVDSVEIVIDIEAGTPIAHTVNFSSNGDLTLGNVAASDATVPDPASSIGCKVELGVGIAETGVTVTGTLNPDATGNYTTAGSHNGRPYWTKAGAYYIWWNGSTKWYLNTVIGDISSGNYWSRTNASPAGAYTATGTYTGTATAALASSWTEVDDVRTVTITLNSENQAYVSSGTAGTTRRAAGNVDASVSYSIYASDFASLPTVNSVKPARVYVNDADYWLFEWLVFQEATNLEVDREGATLVGATINASFSGYAVIGGIATEGSIVDPDDEDFWPGA